jgi:putative hydroxymethylpyrimidine transporter CytX
MVLLRGVLGRRGSYVPTALNVAQLIGWTAFELWAMALVASRVTGPIFGVPSFFVWLAVASVICVALTLGGPVLVVRQWLERFGVWVLMAAAAWITVRVLTTVDLGALFAAGAGPGAIPAGAAIDLVIAMPVSWIPLVADYNRFARRGTAAGTGTYVGYLAANVWFYTLGALLILGAPAGLAPSPAGLGEAIATFGGGTLVLLVLLVGETDEAFADIYSAAVSVRNAAPRLPQRTAVVVVAAVGVGIAAWLFGLPDEGVLAYEFFLLLLGSVFVPLFAVFLADYFVLHRGGYGEDRLFDRSEGTRAGPLVAWALGFVVYHAFTAQGPDWWIGAVGSALGALGIPHPVGGGVVPASVVAFAAAFLGALLFSRRPRAGSAAAPPPSARPTGRPTRS